MSIPYHRGVDRARWERPRPDVPVQVTWSVPHPEQAGRMLDAIARDWGVTPREGAGQRLLPAGAIFFQMDEADVQRIMAHRLAMIGSDGLPHDTYPHPRLWGTFPRVLGHYARDLGLFSMEQAVRKMTGHTAEVFGLTDRGVIRAGALPTWCCSTRRPCVTWRRSMRRRNRRKAFCKPGSSVIVRLCMVRASRLSARRASGDAEQGVIDTPRHGAPPRHGGRRPAIHALPCCMRPKAWMAGLRAVIESRATVMAGPRALVPGPAMTVRHDWMTLPCTRHDVLRHALAP